MSTLHSSAASHISCAGSFSHCTRIPVLHAATFSCAEVLSSYNLAMLVLDCVTMHSHKTHMLSWQFTCSVMSQQCTSEPLKQLGLPLHCIPAGCKADSQTHCFLPFYVCAQVALAFCRSHVIETAFNTVDIVCTASDLGSVLYDTCFQRAKHSTSRYGMWLMLGANNRRCCV